ncbi:hypothetical protein DASC09_021690 [Saccharomycopsis crataegensis]|uniref:Uncharacterized protein n=1 Tax=Saccharomycopsis crataegensis TaxID=43959 RepID=A0AAV5QKA6_9ASCO|nr:hypothetical protein DASC09_021690 [Saccharomycopsis crataegensis]
MKILPKSPLLVAPHKWSNKPFLLSFKHLNAINNGINSSSLQSIEPPASSSSVAVLGKVNSSSEDISGGFVIPPFDSDWFHKILSSKSKLDMTSRRRIPKDLLLGFTMVKRGTEVNGTNNNNDLEQVSQEKPKLYMYPIDLDPDFIDLPIPSLYRSYLPLSPGYLELISSVKNRSRGKSRRKLGSVLLNQENRESLGDQDLVWMEDIQHLVMFKLCEYTSQFFKHWIIDKKKNETTKSWKSPSNINDTQTPLESHVRRSSIVLAFTPVEATSPELMNQKWPSGKRVLAKILQAPPKNFIDQLDCEDDKGKYTLQVFNVRKALDKIYETYTSPEVSDHALSKKIINACQEFEDLLKENFHSADQYVVLQSDASDECYKFMKFLVRWVLYIEGP